MIGEPGCGKTMIAQQVCAQTACLKAGGYTVVILGNGLDICYSSEHHKLMECIEQNGLLLSEYPPGTRPTQYTFPRRN